MDKQRLLDAAVLKRTEVVVLGQKITCVEPPIGVRMDYLRQLQGLAGWKADKDTAVAMLISKCCFDDDGKEVFTMDEAIVVAKGSQRVAGPLLNAILGKEEESEVKNDSAPSDDSSSLSPAISDGQLVN